MVWNRHERRDHAVSHSLMIAMDTRACRPIILDPIRPHPTRPRRPPRASRSVDTTSFDDSNRLSAIPLSDTATHGTRVPPRFMHRLVRRAAHRCGRDVHRLSRNSSTGLFGRTTCRFLRCDRAGRGTPPESVVPVRFEVPASRGRSAVQHERHPGATGCRSRLRSSSAKNTQRRTVPTLTPRPEDQEPPTQDHEPSSTAGPPSAEQSSRLETSMTPTSPRRTKGRSDHHGYAFGWSMSIWRSISFLSALWRALKSSMFMLFQAS